MTYRLAILVEREGGWTETFGDHEKDCVDFEVETWKDTQRDVYNTNAFKVYRKRWPRVPGRKAVAEWAAECVLKFNEI